MEGEILFRFRCKDDFPYKDYPEALRDSEIEVRSNDTELNVHQYYELFKRFLAASGFNEYCIMDGAFRLAFNESNEESMTKRLMNEYEIQDVISQYEIDELVEKRVLEIINDPDAITVIKLKNANVVCNDCGQEYGEYSVGCSSTWEGTCNVCGEIKGVTEVRDWGYLAAGILKLKK